ncbi:MAG TPA: acyl-homoserine-lactone synthase [Ktedonobacterales bacterium]
MSCNLILPRDDASPRLANLRFSMRVVSASDLSLLAAQRLRAGVFVQELGWVAACACGLEHDRCDAVATHFVLLVSSGSTRLGDLSSQWSVAGYARIMLPEHTFMLEREFPGLLPQGFAIHEPARSFEVSRFVVHPRARGKLDAEGRSAAEHLQRDIARWALAHDRDHLYSVCETRHVRALRLRGLPVQRFGRVMEYTPGVHTCAMRLDLTVAGEILALRRPRDAHWYTQGVARW